MPNHPTPRPSDRAVAWLCEADDTRDLMATADESVASVWLELGYRVTELRRGQPCNYAESAPRTGACKQKNQPGGCQLHNLHCGYPKCDEFPAAAPTNPPEVDSGVRAEGAGLHPATADLVSRFAVALAEKLAAAERKYGYSDGWASPDWLDECREKLLAHVAKGDPRDVAAYCAFLWHHGEHTASASEDSREPVGSVYTMEALVPRGSVKYHVELNRKLPAGTKLYTHPTQDAEDAARLYTAAEKGYHISETCGPESKYWFVSKFRTMEDLHAFTDAWHALMFAARPEKDA